MKKKELEKAYPSTYTMSVEDWAFWKKIIDGEITLQEVIANNRRRVRMLEKRKRARIKRKNKKQ